MKKILIIGYNRRQTRLFAKLDKLKNIKVDALRKNSFTPSFANRYDLIVVYGYRKIINPIIISKIKTLIINLHISYLPHCRGAHPNFWSFVENAPHGVTIHELDSGIDTGKILFQKQVEFNLFKNYKKLTFEDTYKVLTETVEDLFLSNLNNLLDRKVKKFEQIGKGSYHKIKDLPSILKRWDQNIYKTINEYSKKQKKIMVKNLKTLDEIENTRRSNNVNWMNIIRTSMKNSQKETLDLLKMINSDDNKISKLFRKLNNDKNQ